MSRNKRGFNFRKDEQSNQGHDQHSNSESSSDDDFDQSIELSHGSLIIDGQVTEYTQIHTDQSCSSERDLLHSIEVSYEGLDGEENEGEEYVCIDVAADVDPSLIIKKENPAKLQRVDTFDILETAKDFVDRSVSISSTDDFFEDGSCQRMNTRRTRNLLSFSSQTSQISEEEFFEIEEIEETEEIITYLEEEEKEEEENNRHKFSYSSADIERYHSLPSGSQYNTKHFFGSPRSAKSEIGEVPENIEDLIFSAISSPILVSDNVEETSYPSSFYTKIKGSVFKKETESAKTDQYMDIYTNESLTTRTNMQRKNDSFDQEIEISSLDYSSPSILESQEETLSTMMHQASDYSVEDTGYSISEAKSLQEEYLENTISFNENNKDEEVFVLKNKDSDLNNGYEEISVDINVDEDDNCDNCIDIDFVAKFDKFLEEEYSLEQEVNTTQNNVDEVEQIEVINDNELYSENPSMTFEPPILTNVSSDIEHNTQFTVVACDIIIDENKDNFSLIEKADTDLNFEKIAVDISIEEDKAESLEIECTVNTFETLDSNIELELESIDDGEMDETVSNKNTIEDKERPLKAIKGKVYTPIEDSIDVEEADETVSNKNTIENKKRPLKTIKGKVYTPIEESIDDGEMDEIVCNKIITENEEHPVKAIKDKVYTPIEGSIDGEEVDETVSNKNTIENKERPLQAIKGKVYTPIEGSIDGEEVDETVSNKNTIENKERPLKAIKGKVYTPIEYSIDGKEVDETVSNKNTIENKERPLKAIKGKVYTPIEYSIVGKEMDETVSNKNTIDNEELPLQAIKGKVYSPIEYSVDGEEVHETVSNKNTIKKKEHPLIVIKGKVYSPIEEYAFNYDTSQEVSVFPNEEYSDIKIVNSTSSLNKPQLSRSDTIALNDDVQEEVIYASDIILDSKVIQISKSMQNFETQTNIKTHTDADMILDSDKQIVSAVVCTDDQSVLFSDVECADKSFDIEFDSSLHSEDSLHLEVDVAKRQINEISEAINDDFDDNSSSDESSYKSCDDNDSTQYGKNVIDEVLNNTLVFPSKTTLDAKMMFDKIENEMYNEDSSSSSSSESDDTDNNNETNNSSSDSRIDDDDRNIVSLKNDTTKDFEESLLSQPVSIDSSLTIENVTIEQKTLDIASNSLITGQPIIPLHERQYSDIESSDDTSDESSTSSSDESISQDSVEILSNSVVENKLAIIGATVTDTKNFPDNPFPDESLTESEEFIKATLNNNITTQPVSEKEEPVENKRFVEFPSKPSLDMELFPSSTLEFVSREIHIESNEYENYGNLEKPKNMINNSIDISDEVQDSQSSDDLFSSTLNVELPDNSNHEVLFDCDDNHSENKENDPENNPKFDSFKIDDSYFTKLELQNSPFKLDINQNQNTDFIESGSTQSSSDKSFDQENAIELEANSESVTNDSTYSSLNILSSIEGRERLIDTELSLESGNLATEMVSAVDCPNDVINDDSSPRLSCDFETINITSNDLENDSDNDILKVSLLEDVVSSTEDQMEILSESENQTLTVTQQAENLDEILHAVDENGSKKIEITDISEHGIAFDISSESVIEFTETLGDLSSPSTPDSSKSSIDLDISNINSFYIAQLQLEMDILSDETDKIDLKNDKDKPDNRVEKDVAEYVEYDIESTPSSILEPSKICDAEPTSSKKTEKGPSFLKPSSPVSTATNSPNSLGNFEEEIVVSEVASVECSVEMTFDTDDQTLEKKTNDDLNLNEETDANDFLQGTKETASDTPLLNSDVFIDSSILVRPPSVDFISSGNFEEKLESLDFILEECSASTNFKPRKSEIEPLNMTSSNQTDLTGTSMSSLNDVNLQTGGIIADDSSPIITGYPKEDFHYIELPRTLSTSSFISSGTLEDELASLDFILESLPDKNLKTEKIEIDCLDSTIRTDECQPVGVFTKDVPVTFSESELSIDKDVIEETNELSVTEPDAACISSEISSDALFGDEVVDPSSDINFDNTAIQIDEENACTEIEVSLEVTKEDCEDIVDSVEEVELTIPTSVEEGDIDAELSVTPQIYIADGPEEKISLDLDYIQTENIDANVSTNNAMLESNIPSLSDCSPILPNSENKITEMIRVHSPVFGNLTIKLTGLENTENAFSFDKTGSDTFSQSIEVDGKNPSVDTVCDDVTENVSLEELTKDEESLNLESDDAELELDMIKNDISINKAGLDADPLLESSSTIEIAVSIKEEESDIEEKISPLNIDGSFESSKTESKKSIEPSLDVACLDIEPTLELDISLAEEIGGTYRVDADMGIEKENPSVESILTANGNLDDGSVDVLNITVNTPEKDEITKDMFTNCLSSSLNLINDLTLSLDDPVSEEIEIFEENEAIETSDDNIEMNKSNEKIAIVEDKLDAILAQCISLKEGKRDSLIELTDQKEKDEAILDLSLQDEQELSGSTEIEVAQPNENEINAVGQIANIENENEIEEASIENDLTINIDSTLGEASSDLGDIIIQESHSKNDNDKDVEEEESKTKTEINIDSDEPSIKQESIENVIAVEIEESHSKQHENLDEGKEEDDSFSTKEDILINAIVEIRINELDKEETQDNKDDIGESTCLNSSSSENIDASLPSEGKNSDEERSDLQPLINEDSDSSSTNLSMENTLCVDNNDVDFDGESRSKLISVIIVESDEEADLNDSCGELPYLDLSIDMSDVSKALDSCVPKSDSNDNILIKNGIDSTIYDEAEKTEVDITITHGVDLIVEKEVDGDSNDEEELDKEKKPSLDLDLNVSEESFAAKMDYIFDGFVEPNKRSSKDVLKDMDSDVISEHYDVPTKSVFADTLVEEAEKERDDSISALEEALSELRGSIRPNFGKTISKSKNNIEVRVSVVKKDTPSALFEVDWESNFGKKSDDAQPLPYDDTYATIDGGLYENIDVVSNTNAISLESKWPGTDESLETKEKTNNSDYDVIDNKIISKNKLSLKRKSRNTSTRLDSEKDHLDEKFELENVETVRKEKIDSKKQKGKKKKKSSFFLCACTRGVHD